MIVCHQGYADLKILPLKIGIKMLTCFGSWIDAFGKEISAVQDAGDYVPDRAILHPNLPPPPDLPRKKRGSQQ